MSDSKYGHYDEAQSISENAEYWTADTYEVLFDRPTSIKKTTDFYVESLLFRLQPHC